MSSIFSFSDAAQRSGDDIVKIELSQLDLNEKVVREAFRGRDFSGSLNRQSLIVTAEEEKRLLRRIDRWILPYASLLFSMSFLDRVNIAQARSAGLYKDLHIHDKEYGTSLLFFFIGYIVFHIPSNLLIKRFRPQRWICFCMICWSIMEIATGLVTNYKGLYATRFLLGVFEAGLFPGLILLLSTWYTRKELNTRIAILFAGATLAGALNRLLALGLKSMAGLGGKGGWSWIFIIEGLLAFVVAVPSFWLIQDFPQYSKLLNTQERAKWLHRLAQSQGVTNSPLPFSTRHFIKTLIDWRAHVYAFIASAAFGPFYSISYFIPKITAELGFRGVQANLVTAAPYVVGSIATVVVAIFSDRYSSRAIFIIIMMFVAIIGYAILIFAVPTGVKYGALFLVISGIFPCIPISLTLCANNFGPLYSRATAIALALALANIGGILAQRAYPETDAPRYTRGHALSMMFAGIAIFFSKVVIFTNLRENKRRNAQCGVPDPDGSDCNPVNINNPRLLKKWGLEGKTRQEIIELGDKHPAFRYMI